MNFQSAKKLFFIPHLFFFNFPFYGLVGKIIEKNSVKKATKNLFFFLSMASE
jgi:hypothetical protein